MLLWTTATEVRQRIAEAIGEMQGWREVPTLEGLVGAPAGFAVHPFQVSRAYTRNTRRFRGDNRSGYHATSRITVTFLADIPPAAGEEQITAEDVASDAADQVMRRLVHSAGQAWRRGLRVEWVESTIREATVEGDATVLFSIVAFDVEHLIDTSTLS